MAQKSNFMALALFSLLLTCHEGRELQVGVKEQDYEICTPVQCYHNPAQLCYCCPKWDVCIMKFDTPEKCRKECPK
ncbi:hypothetical protein M5K25_025808 [Dendrobium thyrsiflorum]|uniref:Uncharacterized protein n=1 Tax=Dendrobium thyrsiflorum TaxID=117978 RepID=A0ABD0U593_DENTH